MLRVANIQTLFKTSVSKQYGSAGGGGSSSPTSSNGPFSMYWNSNLAPRLGGIKQRKVHRGLGIDNSYLLFYSP